ncbi:unknown [Clostridium sp. CAG:921]|nr:unknown [Clostridium sp. CAG:921]
MCINENVAKNDIEYEKKQYINNKKEYINSIFLSQKNFEKILKKYLEKLVLISKKLNSNSTKEVLEILVEFKKILSVYNQNISLLTTLKEQTESNTLIEATITDNYPKSYSLILTVQKNTILIEEFILKLIDFIDKNLTN